MDTIAANQYTTAEDAKLEAQKLAFAPIAFQAVRSLRDSGILTIIEAGGKLGVTLEELYEQVALSPYGIYVLVDAGVSCGVIIEEEGRYTLTLTGSFILNDRMTRVNMDFSHDVCYQGFFHLDEALRSGTPSGLAVFGEWATVYEALASLPEQVRKSWFGFDHYFSDSSFPKALPIVLKEHPKRMLDVGGNTGKWALQCAAYDPELSITILDLPGQLREAEENSNAAGYGDRISTFPINFLDHSLEFPQGYDVIWMSQFLDCFPPEDIISIITRAGKALNKGGTLYIMETFVDRQRYATAKYCLDMTSLYFTAIANGTSRMYHAEDMISYVREGGFGFVECIDRLGISHSLLRCRKE